MPAITYQVDTQKINDLFIESDFKLQKDLASAIGITGPSLRAIQTSGKAGQKALLGLCRFYRRVHKHDNNMKRISLNYFLADNENPISVKLLGKKQ